MGVTDFLWEHNLVASLKDPGADAVRLICICNARWLVASDI